MTLSRLAALVVVCPWWSFPGDIAHLRRLAVVAKEGRVVVDRRREQ